MSSESIKPQHNKQTLPVTHMHSAVGRDTGEWYHRHMLTLVCPCCRNDYQHVDGTETIDGKDYYEAWEGRGDLVIVKVWGECGSTWEMCFGFHKGNTAT